MTRKEHEQMQTRAMIRAIESHINKAIASGDEQAERRFRGMLENYLRNSSPSGLVAVR